MAREMPFNGTFIHRMRREPGAGEQQLKPEGPQDNPTDGRQAA